MSHLRNDGLDLAHRCVQKCLSELCRLEDELYKQPTVTTGVSEIASRLLEDCRKILTLPGASEEQFTLAANDVVTVCGTAAANAHSAVVGLSLEVLAGLLQIAGVPSEELGVHSDRFRFNEQVPRQLGEEAGRRFIEEVGRSSPASTGDGGKVLVQALRSTLENAIEGITQEDLPAIRERFRFLNHAELCSAGARLKREHTLAKQSLNTDSGHARSAQEKQVTPPRQTAELGGGIDRRQDLVTQAASGDTPSGNVGELTNDSEENVGGCRGESSKKLYKSDCNAYLSFEYAQSLAGKKLADQAAHDLLKETGIPDNEGDRGELADYELPSFETWSRQLRHARQALGEQKNTSLAGRSPSRSIVRADEI